MSFPRARFGGTGVESQHPAYGRSLRVLVASVAGVVVLGCSEQMPEPSAVAGPKLILLIGDGMDPADHDHAQLSGRKHGSVDIGRLAVLRAAIVSRE